MARRVTLRLTFLLAMVAVVCLVVVTYVVIAYHIRTTDLIQDANVQLLSAGHFARTVAGPGYHDRIVDKSSVPMEDFGRIVATYDELCLKLGLQYIWSLMELDGKLVFTTATHSVLTNQNSDCATFLEVHTNPEAYRHALATMQPEFTAFHDKWGEGRMVLLPAWDQKHRKYLFAASVQLASFDALLRRTLLEAILGGLLVAALFSLIAGVLARVLTRPLTRLTEDIERMGHGEFDRPFTVGGVQELKILADAFTAMRQQVRQQVEALRASEERFRSLVENLGIGVALISPKMEILALNRQMRTWYPHVNVAAKSICYQAFNDPPRAEACSYCPVTKTFQDGEVHEAITETSRTGGVTYFRIVASPLKDEAGQVQGVIETVEDITVRKRMDDALQRSHVDLNAILESTPDIICLLDAHDGRLQHFNAAFARETERTYGVHPQVGMTAQDILPADRVPAWTGFFQRALTQGPFSLEYLRSRDQTCFEINFNTVRAENRLTSVSVFIRDITARKQVEAALRESEGKYRSVVTAMGEGIVLHNATGEIITCNPSAERILGLTEDQMKGKTSLDPRWQSIHEDGSPFAGETHPAMVTLRTGKPMRDVVMGVRTPEGTSNWININTAPFFTPGTPAPSGVIVSFADITVRKRAEAALRESEALLRSFFDSPGICRGVMELDGDDLRFVSLNSATANYFGQEVEAMRGKTLRELLGYSMEKMRWWLAHMEECRRTGQPVNFEYHHQFLDRDRWLSFTWSHLGNGPTGRPRFAYTAADITARKQAEAVMVANENRLRAFLDNSAIIGWMKDEEGRHVFVSDNFLRRFQTRREDRIGKTDFEIWPRQIAEELRQNDLAVMKSGRTVEAIEEVPNPDGSPSWWLVSKFVFQDAAGKRFVGGLGVDITVRKQSEAQLRESEERYRWLADHTEDFVSVHDVQEKRLYISPSFYRATGWTPADLDGSPWNARLHPDDLPTVTFARAANRAGKSTLIEHRIRCRNGDWLWVEARCKPVVEPDGQVRRFIIWSHDITARKLAEEALHDSQAHLAAVLESTQDLIWSLDANTLEVLSFNSAFAQELLCVYGIHLRTGMNLREIIPADRIPMWEQLLQRAIKQGRYSDEYFRSDHPKYFERTFNPVVEEGQATRVAIFARDITARKRAETALLESEEKFLRLAGHIESVLYSLDATTREFRYLSPAFEKLFGYSVEDIQLMGGRRAFLAHVIQGDQFKEQDRYLADVQLEDQATSFRTESWWRCKDGSLRYTQDHWMPVYEQDKLVSTEGILTDITKEKAADDKLKASEARLKDAQRLAKLGSWNWDLVSQQITWSDELYAIWGFDRGAPPSSLVQYMKLFLPKALLDLQSGLSRAAPAGEGHIFETEFLRDDGTGGHLLVQGTSVRGEDGRLIRLYGTVQDVTDRKRLEQQILKISEREQRRIGQDLHDGVGQQLTALRFLSSALRQKLLDHKTVAAGEFARLDTLLSETIKEVRGLARGLHPVNADSHGLMHGLQELCRTMQFVFGVSCVFECANPVLVHDPTVALNLYRITQEAVRNAATHGKPKTICVQLSRQEQTLKLVVSDDGQGLPREKKQQGMGLEIMQYRASAIGASLAVQSEPGAGVTITVTLPIPS